jgi:hypothetical protein
MELYVEVLPGHWPTYNTRPSRYGARIGRVYKRRPNEAQRATAGYWVRVHFTLDLDKVVDEYEIGES